MSFVGGIDIPFEQFDTESKTIDSTGGALSVLFTDLVRTKQREILIRNRGEVNVLIGATAATARWPIEPGDVLKLAAKDLAKVAIKTASGTAVVDLIQVI